MSTERIVLALPSKGRLMEETVERLAAAGSTVRRTGAARGYRGVLDGLDGVDVAFQSASEIAYGLKSGRVHLGVTGEDLLREHVPAADHRIGFDCALGYGAADVIVAVPDCWIDVRAMADIERVAPSFRARHGRHLRVATKFRSLTRRYFADKGVAGYRIVDSIGATEGAPAAGTAEIIVDITSTGATLKANHLRQLDDGLILASQAWLASSRAAPWSAAQRRVARLLVERVAAATERQQLGI